MTATPFIPTTSGKFQKVVATVQDPNGIDVLFDAATHALCTLGYAHCEIHSGSHFFCRDFIDLGNGLTYKILLTTPNTTKWAHMVVEIEHELEASVVLTEGVATTSNGTAMNTFNRNRNVAGTATTILTHTPINPTGGTAISQDQKGSGKKFGAQGRDSEEIVLKQNTKYLVSITNETANNNLVNWTFDWYEHTDKD